MVHRDGHGLKRETVSRSMTTLEKLGLARPDDGRGPFRATVWTLVSDSGNGPCDPCDINCDRSLAHAHVTVCDFPKKLHGGDHMVTRDVAPTPRSHGWNDPLSPSSLRISDISDEEAALAVAAGKASRKRRRSPVRRKSGVRPTPRR